MLYKYVGSSVPEDTIKYLKYYLEDGKIRATRPNDFNDPAEFKVNFDYDADIDAIKKRFFELWPNHHNDEFERWLLSQTEHSRSFDNYMIRTTFLQCRGVICLTKRPDNYLMWSHYAHSHSGFCIGFDDGFINAFDDGFFVRGEVKYSSDVPVVNFFTDSAKEIAAALCLNKSDVWEYEEEVRIVTENCGVKLFDKSLIKEITIGCKASSQLQNYVHQLFDSGIEIYKMKCPPGSYKLEKIRLEKDTDFLGY